MRCWTPEFAHGGPTAERKAETGLASPRAKGNLDISQQPPVSGENNVAHPSLKPHRAISASTNQPYFTGCDCVAQGLGRSGAGLAAMQSPAAQEA